ncbi:glycosyltransferase [Dokdonia sp. Hel_I_53]|uniref:glycosyltransferase n=1 Tax=Dokdonia sp. Hel_I_53 TaxID=1566287 RepID=UPI00119A510F|nr:glycosyltransferase [Dokdonia sp. Hel_I_53]TVZ53403.1 glycosyltransferase involved in cell wall biosynthesis [Dokdonia sp. Hel_I_53]
MRVLQLIDTLEAGGAERMAVNIANGLLSHNVNSYICATRHEGQLKSSLASSVTYLFLEKKSKWDIRAYLNFFRWIKREEIEIIHAHSTSIYLAVLAKIKNPKLKIIWHDHYGLSEKLQERPRTLLKFVSKYFDQVIAVNFALVNWSRDILSVKKVAYIPNFASFSNDEIKKTNLMGIEGKRVVCLANLRPQKNHIELIEAFRQSIVEFSDWTLHLVGQSFDDLYAFSINEYINNYKLQNKVFLYGSCQDVQNILNQSDIGVLVSHSEGLPVSLLEYGNATLPAIVTNVGQCAAVVDENGIVIDNVSRELKEALLKYYNLSNEEASLVGKRFRESVRKSYSKEAFFKKLIPIYRRLLF